MRGLNSVVISGNVGNSITFGDTRAGTPACSFSIASDRHTFDGIISAWVKINAYGDVVRVCEERLEKGCYVMVSGELMNRTVPAGELLEVRAREIIFIPTRLKDEDEEYDEDDDDLDDE
jgi:single-stranded DNA-binding protein